MNAWVRLLGALLFDALFRILFDLGSWTPDLLLLAIIYITMTRPLGEAYFMAFLSGIVWDAMFLDIIGTHAFLFVMTALLVSRLRMLIWGQYAISRLFLGFLFSGIVRFGEVIFWLSILEYELPIEVPKNYILHGALVTGFVFLCIPWQMHIHPFALHSQRAPLTEKWSYE